MKGPSGRSPENLCQAPPTSLDKGTPRCPESGSEGSTPEDTQQPPLSSSTVSLTTRPFTHYQPRSSDALMHMITGSLHGHLGTETHLVAMATNSAEQYSDS